MRRIENNTGRNKGMYVAIFIVATFIASLLFIFFDNPDWRWVLSAYFYTFAFWLGNYGFSIYLTGKLPRLKDARKRLFYSIIFVIIYTLFVVLIWEGIMFQYHISLRKFIAIYFFSVGVTVLISSLNAAVEFFNLFKKSIEEKEAIKRSQVETELNVLSSQVNPHFLFNSLNTLMSIIPENSDLAITFTQKLSDVYRYSLQGRKRDLVTLGEELKMAESYIFLMRIRYGQNLIVEEDIPEKYLSMKLPVLSLQLIIENAVKHNAVSMNKPLTIRMRAFGHFFEVWNNKNHKQEKEPGTGTGLDNIRRRYALYSDQELIVENDPNYFLIKIPLMEVLKYEGTDH
jgi:LytS/YehU family sensor histidine kinase